MSVFVACLLVCGVALIVLCGALPFDVVRARALRATEKHVLERSGLVATVEPWSARRLEGVREGVPIRVVHNASRPLPGKAGQTDGADPWGTWMELTAPGSDLLVCRKDLSDLIVGPLPASERMPTGDARFDAAFDVFRIGVQPIAPLSHDQRELLRALGLSWLRRKDGKLELFFEDLTARQMAAAVDLALSIVRPSQGAASHDGHYRDGALVRLSDEALPGASYSPPRTATALVVAVAVSLVVGPVGGLVLPLLSPVQDLFAEVACEPGAALIGTRSQAPNGTYIGVACQRPGQPFTEVDTMLNVAGGVLATSLPLGVGLLLTLARLFGALRRYVPKE